ncbi:MAG: hypothetical protein MZV63_69585 [Marinilabiliales bacterium]|nr:hypothetical protein [Marinilabiliales bacterium]
MRWLLQADSGFRGSLCRAWPMPGITCRPGDGIKPYIEGVTRAKEYFDRALELDPNCAEAHAVRGVWYILSPEEI